jgi:hypothetical protein
MVRFHADALRYTTLDTLTLATLLVNTRGYTQFSAMQNAECWTWTPHVTRHTRFEHTVDRVTRAFVFLSLYVQKVPGNTGTRDRPA